MVACDVYTQVSIPTGIILPFSRKNSIINLHLVLLFFSSLFVYVSFQFVLSWFMTSGQILRKELEEYKIDPLNLNGTEPYTELTIDQIIMRAMGGVGRKSSFQALVNIPYVVKCDVISFSKNITFSI